MFEPHRRQTRPAAPALTAALRYHAVVLGTGEIPAIVESLGRRRLRTIEPRSREGRGLLAGGRVDLWRDPLTRGERVPVAEILGRLRASAERDAQRHPQDARWRSACGRRLDAIRGWESLYAAGDRIDH